MFERFDKGRFFFFLLIALLISGVVPSCSDAGEGRKEQKLTLSSEEIVFPYEATSRGLAIESFGGEYTVVASQDWITTEKQVTGISVIVTENTSGEEREGKLVISAGELSKEVRIKQAGAPVTINVLPEQLSVAKGGGSETLQVVANTKSYEVSSLEEWIHITPNVDKGTVAVQIDENTTGTPRRGNINFVVANQVVKTVEVSQEGNVKLFLPYFKFGATAEQVKQFEQERKSILNREHDITGTGTQLAYGIKDQIFNEANYLVGLKGMQQVSLFVKDGMLSDENKLLFEDYLRSQGFEERTLQGYETTLSLTPKEKTMFINEQLQVKAELMKDRGQNHYRFVYYPVQLKAQPTFSNFPYFKKGATKAEVQNYEAGKGGTYSEEKSKINYGTEGAMKDRLFYTGENEQTFSRIYYIYYQGQKKQGLTQVSHYYSDHSSALYQGADGAYYLTREFIKLAKDNGYEYATYSSKLGYIFNNQKLGVKLYVLWYKDERFNWTLRLNIY